MKFIAFTISCYFFLYPVSSFCETPRINLDSTNACVLKLLRVYGVLAIEAEINGINGLAIVDTGIKEVVLNDQIFTQSNRSNKIIYGVDGRASNLRTMRAQIDLGCFMVKDRNCWVMPIDHIFPEKNIIILGMIGWDVFKNMAIKFNLPDREMLIYNPQEETSWDDIEIPLSTVDLKVWKQTPYITCRIGSKNLKLVLDTGAGINVMCSSLKSRINSGQEEKERRSIRGWSGKSEKLAQSDVKNLEISHFKIKSMRTIWTSLRQYSGVIGYRVDGIIGVPLFLEAIVEINFAQRKVKFYTPKTPESDFLSKL